MENNDKEKLDTESAHSSNSNDRTSPTGMDNPAFEMSETRSNDTASPTDKKSHTLSSTSSSGSGSQDEVNLELVDMTPPKIMAKDDSSKLDVEKGIVGDEKKGAFGEHFVPVNELKKGIR